LESCEIRRRRRREVARMTKILLVDDSKFLRMATERALAREDASAQNVALQTQFEARIDALLVPVVPCNRLHPLHALSTPVATRPVIRLPNRLVPEETHASGFDDT
jgi:hypothetical protein